MEKLKKIINTLLHKNEKNRELEKSNSDIHTYLTVQEISKKIHISASNINTIFEKLEWCKKDNEHGWAMTDQGEYHGAKVCHDEWSNANYLVWKESMLENPYFKRAIEEYKKH